MDWPATNGDLSMKLTIIWIAAVACWLTPAPLAYYVASRLGAEPTAAAGIAVPVFFASALTECFGLLTFIERRLFGVN